LLRYTNYLLVQKAPGIPARLGVARRLSCAQREWAYHFFLVLGRLRFYSLFKTIRLCKAVLPRWTISVPLAVRPIYIAS
jgi:hypothetical protein